MEAIIHAFGIDWRLIAIQLFNFALLLGGLWYFLYDPVLTMLEKRRALVEKGVRDAEEAARTLSEAETEKAQIIQGAHAEAGDVALRAKAHAEEKTAHLLSEAKEKSDRLIAEARREGDLLKEHLYKESEADIAKMALLSAEKILTERS